LSVKAEQEKTSSRPWFSVRIDVRKPPDFFWHIAYRSGMELKASLCYRAVLARDARYDGRFFTCVKTTGIYCRPICPARPPKAEHCVFVPTAAAAQEAGFRPCLRCRPESSPDLDAWRGTSATVSRALKLIEGGALDDDGDVASLADRLEIGERHLRRLFRQHIGAAPVTVAQTRRVLLAKQLIHQTDLSMIQIAMASGFGSVRRFNEVFQQLYNRPPSELRRRAAVPTTASSPSPEISLLLAYRPPYDWESMLGFLSARAIDGLEVVTLENYSRVIAVGDSVGSISVSHEPAQSGLRVIVRFPKLSVLPMIIARIRRMFDLSADPGAIAAVLSADPALAPLVAARPGLRLPGGWNGFEIAVRAILGQQITVKGAMQLATRIVHALGDPIEDGSELRNSSRSCDARVALDRRSRKEATQASQLQMPREDQIQAGFTRAFPRPERFETSALKRIGMPESRAAALANVAAAIIANPRLFDPSRDLDQSVAALRSLPGIGEWTAQYIAMRALGESDAFAAGDVGIQRALAGGGRRPTATEALARAERWRPWRAYAMLHLWMGEADWGDNQSRAVSARSVVPSARAKQPGRHAPALSVDELKETSHAFET
jgi:AraC family transcriptional regulator of adaptative response / DNA-3-methyladenine glycosylase II